MTEDEFWALTDDLDYRTVVYKDHYNEILSLTGQVRKYAVSVPGHNRYFWIDIDGIEYDGDNGIEIEYDKVKAVY